MANDSLEQLALHTIGGGWGSETKDATNNIRVSVIRGTDIPRLRVGDCSSVPVRYESGNKVKNRLLKPGDIVIEVSGGSAASGQHTGRALFVTQRIVDSLGGNVIPASFCRLLRLDAERVNPNFIVYQIDGLHLTGEISEFENQSTGIANFQFSRFVQETFPCIEDLRSQTAIAHILGTLDDKIELNRKQNETLEAMSRALFKAWFVDFEPVRAKMEGRWQRGQSRPGLPAHLYDLFPDRLVDSELGEIPEGWEVSSIGKEFDIIMGQSPPGSTYNDIKDGLPFFQGKTDFGFRYPENRKYCSAPNRIANIEDTLISVRAPVGDINLAWEKCCIGRGVAAIRHTSKSRSFTYYTIWSLQNELRQFEDNGTVFGSINKKQLEEIKFVKPSDSLISFFECSSKLFDDEIRNNIEQSRTLIQLRDTLLPKLISGKLRVKDIQTFLQEYDL